MGMVIPMAGGGGGADLDVITATASDVRAKKVIVDREGNPVIGTEPDRGAVSAALNCGDSYTIPEGYHNGAGNVNANSLASQTGGVTADDAKVLAGYTYWKEGVKRTGTLAIRSVVDFKVAQYTNLTILVSWALPAIGPWSGLSVWAKQGGYPSYRGDGKFLGNGSSGTGMPRELPAGLWYVRGWSYIMLDDKFHTLVYSDEYVQGQVNNIAVPAGQQIITQSGIFTVPPFVRHIEVFVVGGGGAGGSAISNSGGGGGGGYTTTGEFDVEPGQQYYVTIGAGGAPTKGNVNHGSTTTFSNLLSANGGNGGMEYNGGSGGSGGGQRGSTDSKYAGNGGWNGGNGALGNQNYWGRDDQAYNGAAGQGLEKGTYAFEDVGLTLYSGGGGGGHSAQNMGGYGGYGGGGDGAYCTAGNPPIAGGVNTGGGGGGARYRGSEGSWTAPRTGAAGGSGICIIRWKGA